MEGTFSLPTGEFGKKVIIFRVDMSSSVHFENKIKDISILDEGLIHRLDDTTLTAVKKCSLNFTKHNEKFSLSLYYNGANSYLFVKGTEIYKFKGKDSEINAISLCLENIPKDFGRSHEKDRILWILMQLQLIIH